MSKKSVLRKAEKISAAQANEYLSMLQSNVKRAYAREEEKDNSFLSQISKSFVKTKTAEKKTRTNARSSTSKTERKDYARELISASDYDRNAISLMYCNKFNQARNSTILTLLSDAKCANSEVRYSHAFREFSLSNRAYELKCESCSKMFFTFNSELLKCASCS